MMKGNDTLGMYFVSSVTKMDTCWENAQARRKEDQKGRTRGDTGTKGRRSDSHLAIISEQCIWTAVPAVMRKLKNLSHQMKKCRSEC